MTRKRAWRLLFLPLALAVLLASVGLNAAAAGTPGYHYLLRVSDYTELTPGQWTMTLELYVFNETSDSPLLGGGSFGLRFPARLGGDHFLGFTEDENNISLSAYDGNYQEKDGGLTEQRYHFFTWTRNQTAKYELQGSIQGKKGVSGPGGATADIASVPGGIYMYLGKYEFLLDDQYPTKGSVGAMNWLKTDLSSTPLYTEAGADGKTLNDEIWSDTDSDGVFAYQGHYPAGQTETGAVVMNQADLRLSFESPKEWPSGLIVESYDPKKVLTMSLYKAETEPAAETQTYPKDPLGSIELSTEEGTDRHSQTVDLSLFEQDGTIGKEIVGDHCYRVVLTKPGHVSVTLEDLYLPEGGSFQELALEEQPYLPCGDLNGDGRIKLDDRSILLAYLNRQVLGYEPGSATDQGLDPIAYLADLNGDGAITLADLNILMASENYNKSAVVLPMGRTAQ